MVKFTRHLICNWPNVIFVWCHCFGRILKIAATPWKASEPYWELRGCHKKQNGRPWMPSVTRYLTDNVITYAPPNRGVVASFECDTWIGDTTALRFGIKNDIIIFAWNLLLVPVGGGELLCRKVWILRPISSPKNWNSRPTSHFQLTYCIFCSPSQGHHLVPSDWATEQLPLLKTQVHQCRSGGYFDIFFVFKIWLINFGYNRVSGVLAGRSFIRRMQEKVKLRRRCVRFWEKKIVTPNCDEHRLLVVWRM